jgi:Chromo (CHRromatin Organisation MOdifier) domain
MMLNPRDNLKASEEYKVEKILDSRYNKRKQSIEYLVHWHGFGPEHNSWQSSQDLHNAPEVLREFKDGLGPHTATGSMMLLVQLAAIAELQDTSLLQNFNMRLHTNFQDETPAHYVGDPRYGYTFMDSFHGVLTPPIAKLTQTGHMGILDILGQWPSYELIISAKPLSLLVAFIPAFCHELYL